ncbi:MAG: hypothetical protein RLZZ427_1739 [Pseudomonadota bacterium]|jgi:Flp pilus assembly protein TadG
MMPAALSLRYDKRAAAAVEFALVAPVFLALLFAIMQFGMAAYARAGVQHAVTAGARYASIYPRPTVTQVKDKVRSSAYGLNPAQIVDPTVSLTTRNALEVYDIQMGYTVRIKFIFFEAQPFTISEHQIAYVVPQ